MALISSFSVRKSPASILSLSRVPTGHWLKNHRVAARLCLTLACGVLIQRCCVRHSDAATTSSTGTKVCQKTPPSGSSSILSLPRCMTSEGVTRRFYAQPTEPFTAEGRKAIRVRIEPLFAEVKQKYGPVSDNPIFRGNEEITLSDRALGFLVAELARYDFARTDIDAKGVAYQELVGTNLRGDRGQYFTPRGAISLMVEMLDPQ